MIVEKLLENAKRKIRIHPCHTNRASDLGHECLRYLVFLRTRWQEAALHDISLQLIFMEGNNQEANVIRDMVDAGIQVTEQQRDYEWKKYQITGHVDGKIVDKVDDFRAYPFEVKSMSPFVFKTIDSAGSLLSERMPHLKKYPAQLQLYMLLSNSEKAVFIFKDKSSGQLKEIWMDLDLGYCESLIQKAERINEHVDKGTTPDPIPWKERLCGRCKFAHICLPEAKRTPAEMLDDPELIAKLERRHELNPLRKEYEDIDGDVKEIFKEREKIMIGDFLVTGNYQQRKDNKKIWITRIEKLQIGGTNGTAE